VELQRYKERLDGQEFRDGGHSGAPLKHRASKIDDDQSGLVIAQKVTKSTATIQGCMSGGSNMGVMEQHPTT
jgi:hypothetical protein